MIPPDGRDIAKLGICPGRRFVLRGLDLLRAAVRSSLERLLLQQVDQNRGAWGICPGSTMMGGAAIGTVLSAQADLGICPLQPPIGLDAIDE